MEPAHITHWLGKLLTNCQQVYYAGSSMHSPGRCRATRSGLGLRRANGPLERARLRLLIRSGFVAEETQEKKKLQGNS